MPLTIISMINAQCKTDKLHWAKIKTVVIFQFWNVLIVILKQFALSKRNFDFLKNICLWLYNSWMLFENYRVSNIGTMFYIFQNKVNLMYF